MRRIAGIGGGGRGGEGGFGGVRHDVRPAQGEALRPRGLRSAASVAEAAAGADAVFSLLPSLESVEAVYLGPGGLVATAPRQATLLQMSTISRGLTPRLAEAARGPGPRL